MFEKTYQTILATLQTAQRVVLVSHRRPDGDTAGAGLALAHYLTNLGKPYTYYCQDAVGTTLQFLPQAHLIGPHAEVWQKNNFDVAVVMDCGDLRHAGVADYLQKNSGKYTLINIDHHITNEHYGDINLVDATASSTCELVFGLLDYARALNKDMATCLLTGLITDTGSFSNLATTANAIKAASHLLSFGANLPHISKNTLSYRPFTTLKLWGRALQRLHDDPTTGMIVTALTLDDIQSCGADEEAVSGISNFLNGLEQAADKAVLVLTQSKPNEIKGSLRTTSPLIDVAAFAKLYGGGGHRKAAGFTLTGTLHATDYGYSISPNTAG